MNIRKSFKNNVALPLTLALSIAASPMAMAENSASTSSHSANKSSVSYSHTKAPTQRKDSVKIKYMPDETRQFAEYWAAIASGKSGKMVVLYGGEDKELQQRVQEGASYFKNAGGQILGMVVAEYDPNLEIKKRDSFAIYVDGARVLGGRNPTKFDAGRIEILLNNVELQTAKHDNTLALNQP